MQMFWIYQEILMINNSLRENTVARFIKDIYDYCLRLLRIIPTCCHLLLVNNCYVSPVCFAASFGGCLLGGGGGTTLYAICVCATPSWRVFATFWSENWRVYTLLILVWNRVWFSRELRSVWTYLSFQFQMSRKEREICQFEMDLNNFCLRSNG